MKIQEGVRITPFNVQEELEEGHFDTDGNYVQDKKDEIRDAWLEELDDYTDEDYEKLMKKKAEDAIAGFVILRVATTTVATLITSNDSKGTITV